MGNVENDGDIYRAWEDIKESIKTSAKESLGVQDQKKYKPWFDEECLGLLHRRNRAKMLWMQDPSQSNGQNLNKVRRDASRHFRNKKKGYLKTKIEELENKSKIKKNIRVLYQGINDFKKGYQPRTDIVNDEKGDIVADSHSILARWRNYFPQLLNVYGVNEIGQADTQQNH